MSITEDACTSAVKISKKTRKDYKDRRWDNGRIFRLGYLAGIGWDAGRIGKDPLILRTANQVRHQVARFGGCLRDTAMGVVLWQKSADFFDAEASRRGLTREKLIQVMLEDIAADKTLFDNIMDDGDRF